MRSLGTIMTTRRARGRLCVSEAAQGFKRHGGGGEEVSSKGTTRMVYKQRDAKGNVSLGQAEGILDLPLRFGQPATSIETCISEGGVRSDGQGLTKPVGVEGRSTSG